MKRHFETEPPSSRSLFTDVARNLLPLALAFVTSVPRLNFGTDGPAGNHHRQEDVDEDDRDADRAGGDGGHELIVLETPAIENAPEDDTNDDDDDREEKLAASK